MSQMPRKRFRRAREGPVALYRALQETLYTDPRDQSRAFLIRLGYAEAR
jgi:hypothetical protein